MNDADRLRVILGNMFEMGRLFGPGDPRMKAIETEKGLNELVKFLDIEFEDWDNNEGDIVDICGCLVGPRGRS